MKIRYGFVSNSSSSSFIAFIQEDWKRKEVLKLNKYPDWKSSWGGVVEEFNEYIIGHTTMDNLGIEDFLNNLEIPSCHYKIDDHCGWVALDFMKSVIELAKSKGVKNA